ncbi:MAG: hypothetical protein AB7E24_23610 [Novosphingobium sp.]
MITTDGERHVRIRTTLIEGDTCERAQPDSEALRLERWPGYTETPPNCIEHPH